MNPGYADTAVLVKSYTLESNSGLAISLLEKFGQPLLISHFHLIEIPNAIRLKKFRKEISTAQEKAAIETFQEELRLGSLSLGSYGARTLADVFLKAEELSNIHSGRRGSRSLDLLHVAAALLMGAKNFGSFDERQRQVAASEGLKVFPD